MRLRLCIERNGLPPVSVLWPVTNPDKRLTIAQLLHLIDEKIPLEGDSWGLEDYAVLIGGYEALHYNELGSVCKDEDEIVIRALQWRDRKMRLLAGRDQISVDGRHLVDGVPFGRPLITRAVRPDIRIPPLKRQRLDPEIEGMTDNMLVEWADPHKEDGEEVTEDQDDDDEDDNYCQEESDAEESETGEGASNDDYSVSSNDSDRSDSDSSDESDSSSGSESDSSSGSDLDSEGTSVSFKLSSETGPSSEQQQANSIAISHNQTLDDSKPARSRSAAASVGIPFEGKEATRHRNQRRRESKKLQWLKTQGLLPPDATFQSLRLWETEKEVENEMEEEPETVGGNRVKVALETARQNLLQSLATDGGIDVTTVSQLSQPSQSLEMDEEEDSPPEELSSTAPTIRSAASIIPPTQPTGRGTQNRNVPTSSLGTHSAAAQKRSSLQVGAANNIIFAGLGVRAPKTDAEASALRAKLSQQSSRGTKRSNAGENSYDANVLPEQAQDEGDDPDAWQQKLIVSAVECCDEDITLSAPPFPFRQRWDLQYQGKRKNRDNKDYSNPSKRQKRGKGGPVAQEYYTETYDKYNVVDGDVLDYDDVGEPSDRDDSYWEEGALLEGKNVEDDMSAADQQLLAETAATGKDDSFPPLPADVTTLPLMDMSEATKGDFVVYNELSCSAATNWQPSMVAYTVRLEDESDGGWKVTIAPRDLPPKNYDDDGQRVYAKFEMGGFSDDEDEEDGRTRFVGWNDLIEPRLLRRPASAA